MKSVYLKNGNVYIGIAFLMMGIVYLSSSQSREEQHTWLISESIFKNEPFKAALTKVSFIYGGHEVSIKEQGYLSFLEFFLRKGAHFFSFFILGASWFLGLQPKLRSVGLTFIVAWLAATGYAGLDEFHQMLTPGRTPLMQDIGLDSMGALTACLICLLATVFFHKKKSRKSRAT